MPELPQKKVGIVACSGEELPEGTVTAPGRAPGAGEAAPGRYGDDLPAPFPRRRRGRPGICQVLSHHCPGWLREALRLPRYGDVFQSTGGQPGRYRSRSRSRPRTTARQAPRE